jgi:hypothetical protein
MRPTTRQDQVNQIGLSDSVSSVREDTAENLNDGPSELPYLRIIQLRHDEPLTVHERHQMMCNLPIKKGEILNLWYHHP